MSNPLESNLLLKFPSEQIKEIIKERKVKVLLFPSSKTQGDGYDPYEKNYTYSFLNPVTVYGLMREISPERNTYKEYGLREKGGIEIITDEKHINLFKIARKITVNDNEYQVLKDSGNKLLILKRPLRTIRVVLTRLSGNNDTIFYDDNILDIMELIKDHGQKIYLYFSSETAGTGFDPYEKNRTETNENPLTILGYVKQVSSESKNIFQYGLKTTGNIEVLTDIKYKSWFKTANKIITDGEEYQVYRKGSNPSIYTINNGLMRIFLVHV